MVLQQGALERATANIDHGKRVASPGHLTIAENSSARRAAWATRATRATWATWATWAAWAAWATRCPAPSYFRRADLGSDALRSNVHAHGFGHGVRRSPST